MYFLPLAKQNEAEVWPRFQSLLKLLLLSKGVEWVNLLNASIVPLAMFEIILCPQSSCTLWSHTKRFHTHTGHPPRQRLSLPSRELPGSSAPLVQHLMVQRPITLLNAGNNTTCTLPLLPVPRLALTPVPLMRLPQQLRWSNNLWYRKAHICCFGATINSKRMRRY